MTKRDDPSGGYGVTWSDGVTKRDDPSGGYGVTKSYGVTRGYENGEQSPVEDCPPYPPPRCAAGDDEVILAQMRRFVKRKREHLFPLNFTQNA